MLTRVSTSDNVFTDPGLAQSWTEEDEETMESDGTDTQEKQQSVFHLHTVFEGALGAHSLLQRMHQDKIVEGVIDGSLVKKIANKFEHKHVATGPVRR